MKEKVQIRDKSFDGAGLKKDYKESIIEYILNGFEANANNIYITAKPFSDEMSQLMSLEIEDDGEGIVYESIKETFGTFLISQKSKNVFFDRSNKGKGRYTFCNFANCAKWTTCYIKDEKKLQYEIIIKNEEKDFLQYSEPQETNCKTGTKVEFLGMNSLKLEDITGDELKYKIISFFAKYLYLHKNKHIYINDQEVHYGLIIDEVLSESFVKTINGMDFNCNFIKWISGSNQKSFAYYVDNSFIEKHKEHTKCNNNAVKFYHSLFIVSEYFDNFIYTETNEPLLDPYINQTDKTFKELQMFVYTFVKEKLKIFIKEEVPGIVQSYIDDGLFPEFNEDPLSNEQKNDLKRVVEEVYCIQPSLFYKTKKEQKKAIIGCLNLILKTDERENIITILDSIQKLTPEERAQLANILRKYESNSVVKLLNTINARSEIIEKLKELVFDNTKFTNERDHIQKIVENNYWLFGEEYSLVSADLRLEKVLSNYLHLLDKTNCTDVEYTDPKYKNRRPDIFITGNHDIVTPNNQMQENIIVELKAPNVKLTTQIYRQIEDYMMAVSGDSEFKSSYRNWKFICVCKEIDNEVQARYSTFENYGKKCLVNKINNFEIYAYTWSDVFTIFDLKHNHLYKKLQSTNLNNNANNEECGRDVANNLTEEILKLSNDAK